MGFFDGLRKRAGIALASAASAVSPSVHVAAPSAGEARIARERRSKASKNGRRRKKGTGYSLGWRRIVRLDWFPGDDVRVLRACEGGSLQEVSQLIEALLSDGVVKTGLGIRWGGINLFPVRWYGDADLVAELRGDTLDKNDDGSPDKPIGEFELMHPRTEMRRIHAWGVLLGMGLGEYVEDENGRAVLEALDPHHVHIDGEGCLWWTEGGDRVRITPGDGRWFAWFPYGPKRFWVYGTWRDVAPPWIAKVHARNQRRSWGSRLAAGILLGTFPKGTPQRVLDAFPQRVANLVAPILGVLEGTTVELKESTGRGYEVWTQAEKSSNDEIAIALVASPTLIFGTVGWSSGRMHQEIVGTWIADDASTFGGTINQCGLLPWALRKGRKCPVREWDTTPATDTAAFLTALTALAKQVPEADAALAVRGKRLRFEEVTSTLGVDVEDIDQQENKYGAAEDADLLFGNLPIVVEVEEGGTRTGIGANGPWASVMKGADYGYVLGTNGVDGEPIDAYVGHASADEAPIAFIIEQLDSEGALDEHKVMFGFRTPEEAHSVWLKNVPFPDRFGGMYSVPIDLLSGIAISRNVLALAMLCAAERDSKHGLESGPAESSAAEAHNEKQVRDAEPSPDLNDSVPPKVSQAVRLAEEMTNYGVDQCEHGCKNRCQVCGVERVRGLIPGQKGKPHRWKVEWKAINDGGTK